MEREFSDLIQLSYALGQLQRMIDLDLSRHDLDPPFPRHLVRTDNETGVASRFQVVLDIVDRERPTIRQLIERLAGGRGHQVVAGTPEQITDAMQTWFQNGAADGFNVMPPHLPGGFDVFAAEVVPILRRRGLFREDYTGTTLRDNFGLPRPESSYSHPRRESA